MATLADILRQTGYSQDGTLVSPATDSPMTKALSEHIKTLPQQLATNQAALDSAIASWNKTDFATGKPNPNYRPEAIAELTQLMPNVMGATAWHGTPHKIQGAFDINKIGSGEGNQVYGHGMYFAENPKVAETYRTLEPAAGATPYTRRTFQGQELTPQTPEYHAAHMVDKLGIKKAKAEFADWLKNPPDYADESLKSGWQKSLDTLNAVKSKKDFGTLPFEGNLYKVDIPDEYIPTMLEWDKPLGEQSAFVKKAVNSLKKHITPEMKDELGGNLDLLFGKDVTPTQFLNTWEIIHPESKVGIGEQLLNEAGVKGVKYLDNFSREAGKGTHNFVVFDPSTVKILEENGKPLTRKELIEKQVKKLKD